MSAAGAPRLRQPSRIQLNPSRTYPWYGWCNPGDELTRGQRGTIADMSLDASALEVIMVRRESGSDEMWWPMRSAPPVFEFPCPVLQRLADGRVKVISPSGDRKIVLGDGWVRAPRHRDNRNLAAAPVSTPTRDTSCSSPSATGAGARPTAEGQ